MVASTLVPSCAFKEEEDKEKIQKENTQQVIEVLKSEDQKSELTAENVKISVTPNEQIGYYDVRIEWPKEIAKMRVLVEGENPLIVNQLPGYSFVANHSITKLIHLTAMDSLGRELHKFQQRILIPQDLIFKNEISLQGDMVYSAKRILFEAGSKIITNGFKLVLISKRLQIADQNLESEEKGAKVKRIAQIQTFADNLLSYESEPRSAASIEVQTESASGVLTIHAFGLDGAKGADGKDADQNPDPKLDAPIPEHSVSPMFIPAGLDSVSERYCKVHKNEKPKDGLKGHPGGDAGQGVAGGDAPLTVVNINDATKFKLIVVSRPGKGGQPGVPGKGGPGGKGTYALTFDESCRVKNAKERSKDGEAGDIGKPAQPGEPGTNAGVKSNIPAENLTYLPLRPGTKIE